MWKMRLRCYIGRKCFLFFFQVSFFRLCIKFRGFPSVFLSVLGCKLSKYQVGIWWICEISICQGENLWICELSKCHLDNLQNLLIAKLLKFHNGQSGILTKIETPLKFISKVFFFLEKNTYRSFGRLIHVDRCFANYTGRGTCFSVGTDVKGLPTSSWTLHGSVRCWEEIVTAEAE